MKNNLSISLKIVLSLSLLLIVFITAGTLFNTFRIKKDMESQIRRNMENICKAVVAVCETANRTSVENYLRAIADGNLDLTEYYYGLFSSGQMSEEEALDQLKTAMLTETIGETGYSFVFNISKAPETVTLDIHPILPPDRDLAEHQFVQDTYQLKNGYIEYDWRNLESEPWRSKSLYSRYFEPWDWLICASSYKDEFMHLMNLQPIRDQLLDIQITDSDYVTIFDYNGDVLVHPYLEGKNIEAVKDVNDQFFIRKILQSPDVNGWINYYWKKTEEDETPYQKIGYYVKIPDMEWVVFFSAYTDELFQEMINSRNRLLLSFIAMFFLIQAGILLFAGLFLRPLKLIRKRMENISQGSGDLTTELAVHSRDDVGMVAESFNQFTGTLKNLILETKQSLNNSVDFNQKLNQVVQNCAINKDTAAKKVESVLAGFDQLNDHIRSTMASIGQITGAINGLANLIEEQSAAVNESSATIEEISSSINNISKITTEKEATAQELVKMTKEGGNIVTETGKVIQSITTDAERILEMVGIINSIADQTNILAMNAAIEAAHAGEAGKGFSVVADEIRALAETTSTNAHSITTDITAVTEKIAGALTLSTKMGDSFSKLNTEVEATFSAFTEITVAMKELALSSAEILKAVSSVNSITETVRTDSADMHASAGTISNAMTELEAFSGDVRQDMQNVSINMKELDQHFKDLQHGAQENQLNITIVANKLHKFKTEEDSA